MNDLTPQLSLVPRLLVEVMPDPVENLFDMTVSALFPFSLRQGNRQVAADFYEGRWQVRRFLADGSEAVMISTDRLFVEILVPRSRVYA